MRAVAHDFQEQDPPHTLRLPRSSWATDSLVTPVAVATGNGFQPHDAYIGTFWVPAIGPGAVEDLLRLLIAARRSRSIPEPMFLSTLLVEGLVVITGGVILVPDPIPALGARARNRLPVRLRAAHARFMLERVPESDRSVAR